MVRERNNSPDPKRKQPRWQSRSEEHTSELQSPCNLVCRLLLEKKKQALFRLRAFHALGRRSRRQSQGLPCSAYSETSAACRLSLRGFLWAQSGPCRSDIIHSRS